MTDALAAPAGDPRRTLILIPCSGTKQAGSNSDGVGASVLDSLPGELAERLAMARVANEARAGVDGTSMPAWRRYSRGLLYRSTHPVLERSVHRWPHILMLSGAYGVAGACEPIANYQAPLSLADWPGGLLQEVLTEYARVHRITDVVAFVSRVGDYRAVLELTGWPESVVRVGLNLALYPYDLDPRLTAPRIQGEALAAYLDGVDLSTWADSTGTGGVEHISLLRADGPASPPLAVPPTPTALPAPTVPGANGSGVDAVLVKAATVRQHLRENLEALDLQARGRRVTYSYKERWIAPGVADRLGPGATVLIAMGGRPYDQLVPVRLATVAARDDSQGALVVLDLELGDLVEPDADGFSRAMGRLDASQRPGLAFVGPAPPGFQPTPIGDGDHARIWNRVVDHLQRDPSYRETAFLRLDVVDVDGVPTPAHKRSPALAVGDTVTVHVECRADHLPAAERASTHLLADAPAWSAELEEPLPGAAVVQLARTTTADDRPELAFTLGCRSRWAVSSLLDVALPVTAATPGDGDVTTADAPLGTAGAASVGPDADGVRRLVEALKREGVPPSLALLEDHLLRWCPGDPKLEALRIEALLAAGRGDDAARCLYALAPGVREQVDPRLRFRAAIAVGEHEHALSALGDMVGVDPEDVAMVGRAIDLLPSAAVLAMVRRVADHLLGELAFATLVRDIDPLRLDADDAFAMAEYVEQALAGDSAVDWLQRRLVHAYEPALADFAARLAAATPGQQRLGDWVVDLLIDDLDDQAAGGARSPIARLDALKGDLTDDTRRTAVLRLAERMASLGPLVPHLEQVAREAVTHGDYAVAASVVTLLHRDGAGGAAEELRVHLEHALGEMATVRTLLDMDYDARRKKAAAKTKGRDLIIVGGPGEKTPVKEHLVATFGFASTRWLPCTRDKPPALDALADLRSDRHSVVIVIGHIGHATSEPVRDLCRKAGVRPCLSHADGASTIERSLVDEYASISK